MKRIIAAVVLALLFHAVLFCVKPSWLKRASAVDKKSPAVTITMSYKMPVKPLLKKKQPVEIKKKVAPKKTEKKPVPVKIPEDIPEPVKEDAPVDENVEYPVEDIIDEPAVITEDESSESAPPADGVAGDIVTEAEPLYRENPAPSYPRMARKRGYQGIVVLNVLVNKKGRVDNLMLFESSGYNILDNAALEAVKDWIFVPGRQRDEPVDMWVQVPVVFELK